MEKNFIFRINIIFFLALSISLFSLQNIFPQNNTTADNYTTIERFGMKIKYFDPWVIDDSLTQDELDCKYNEYCWIYLEWSNLHTHISFRQIKFDSSEIISRCQCDTLEEYTKYAYKSELSSKNDFSFVNDTQITLGNNSAIQFEFDYSIPENSGDSHYKRVDILTNTSDSFYHFELDASLDWSNNRQLSKFIHDFKKIINLLEFVPTNVNPPYETKPHKPSFFTSEEYDELLEAKEYQEFQRGNK